MLNGPASCDASLSEYVKLAAWWANRRSRCDMTTSVGGRQVCPRVCPNSSSRHQSATNANQVRTQKQAENSRFPARFKIPGSLSKPPPSATRPPHHKELTIVAQGLADFRLSTLIADFARLSLKLSLPRRRDAWRPREGRRRSRYRIARTRSGSPPVDMKAFHNPSSAPNAFRQRRLHCGPAKSRCSALRFDDAPQLVGQLAERALHHQTHQ
jgi:hypothetical protein